MRLTRPSAATLARGALAAAAVLGTSALGFALPSFGGRVTLPHLATGIAVAALVRGGRSLWPAVGLACIGADLLQSATWVESTFVGIGFAAGAWLIAWLLERHDFDHTFARARDVPLFLAATLIGTTLPATIGDLGFALDPRGYPPVGALGLVRWWSNSFVATLAVAPLVIAARRGALASARARPLESTLYAVAMLALAAGALLLPPPGLSGQMLRPPLFVVLLVLATVGVLRFGFVAAASASLLATIAVAGSFEFDRGLLHGMPLLPGLITLWSVVGAVSGLVLIVTALLAERDAAAAERL
ncbi:MAG: MASE1 domain-containing protein, partial [Proteobacteria bacterium]|nr:MASE1 domain-containing protein [Pseudomonadota bacterium]